MRLIELVRARGFSERRPSPAAETEGNALRPVLGIESLLVIRFASCGGSAASRRRPGSLLEEMCNGMSRS